MTGAYVAIFRWLAGSRSDDPEPLPIFVSVGQASPQLPLKVQAAAISQVADVATVVFVDTPDEAMARTGPRGTGATTVRDDGVLIEAGSVGVAPATPPADITVDAGVLWGPGPAAKFRFQVQSADGAAWSVVGQPQELAPAG